MTIPQSVAEILQQHVTLEVEGIDRMYLNVYVPRLQIVEGVLGFIRRHRGYPVASTRIVEPITRQFVAAIEKFVHAQGIPLINFGKGQRKDDVPPNSAPTLPNPRVWSSSARRRRSAPSTAPSGAVIPIPERPTPGSSSPPRW